MEAEQLIFALIKAESNFNSSAVSGKGAKGLMQLMEETAKDVSKKTDLKIEPDEIGEKLLQADVNIELGTKYISILLEKYNNTAIALTAYNAGIGAFLRLFDICTQTFLCLWRKIHDLS